MKGKVEVRIIERGKGYSRWMSKKGLVWWLNSPDSCCKWKEKELLSRGLEDTGGG